MVNPVHTPDLWKEVEFSVSYTVSSRKKRTGTKTRSNSHFRVSF